MVNVECVTMASGRFRHLCGKGSCMQLCNFINKEKKNLQQQKQK